MVHFVLVIVYSNGDTHTTTPKVIDEKGLQTLQESFRCRGVDTLAFFENEDKSLTYINPNHVRSVTIKVIK